MRRVLATLLLAALCSPSALAGPATLKTIKAFLYYHDTGEIGTLDLINGEGVTLWNSMIGEGVAGRPSSGTYLQVVLNGAPTSLSGTLQVKATEGGATVLQQEVRLDEFFFEKGDQVVVPFLLLKTSCDEVTVTATVVGADKKPLSRLEKKIPFACGE